MPPPPGTNSVHRDRRIFGFGLHADERRVVQAVVRAFELEILSRSVAARAMRHACIVTSVPLEPNRTISTGIALANFFGKLPLLLMGHAEGRAFV